MDIPSFLRQYPPFDELPDERLEEVVRHTHIQFFPARTAILKQGGEPSRYLYVVRTGRVEVIDGNRVADVLGEGEVFGYVSLLTGLGPALSIRALEDSICYLIDHEVGQEIMGTRRGLAFLSRNLREREIRAVDTAGAGPATLSPGTVTVGSLIRRPPVTCQPDATIRQASALMANERVSCLLVPHAEGWGILTDRDLRSRVLARGRSYTTAVSEVMTTPVHTVPPDTMSADVILRMLELGVHHLPVVDGDGEPIGVVTDTDLMGMERKTPFALRSEIERAANQEQVVSAAASLPEAICNLVEAGSDPLHVCQIIAVTRDAVARRLLELGISELGDPPAPWAWLALGSEARYEQALLTDQDHALAYEPRDMPVEMLDPYFAKLAERVTAGIEATGIRRCRAGVIAASREWRRPVAEWILQFRRWTVDPGRVGSAYTGIAFDFRRIGGPLDVEPDLHQAIRRAAGDREFIRHLARGAIEIKPPTGFIRDLVVEAKGSATGTLDVKQGGITPITNLARVWALSAGITENRTLNRLAGAVDSGRISDETRAGLEDGFGLLWQIRLEHQTAQVRTGRSVDDDVDPRTLTPLTRQGLKETFRLIDRAQGALATELGLRR